MSSDYERLVGCIIYDEDLRELLLNDPDAAMKKFNLTDEEKAKIRQHVAEIKKNKTNQEIHAFFNNNKVMFWQ